MGLFLSPLTRLLPLPKTPCAPLDRRVSLVSLAKARWFIPTWSFLHSFFLVGAILTGLFFCSQAENTQPNRLPRTDPRASSAFSLIFT